MGKNIVERLGLHRLGRTLAIMAIVVSSICAPASTHANSAMTAASQQLTARTMDGPSDVGWVHHSVMNNVNTDQVDKVDGSYNELSKVNMGDRPGARAVIADHPNVAWTQRYHFNVQDPFEIDEEQMMTELASARGAAERSSGPLQHSTCAISTISVSMQLRTAALTRRE